MRRRTALVVASAGLATACAASVVAVALPEEKASAATVEVTHVPEPQQQPQQAATEQPQEQPKQEQQEAAASRSEQRSDLSAATRATSPSAVKELARDLVPAAQFAAFSSIISHESGWNVKATNASSGAYGLAQALPGSKMASVGADWKTNPATQIKWALKYMNDRYGSPNAAWAFWQTHHWY
ncbi:transglycosylase SLT domain-containing protein [Kitasatospora sp. NPDC051853]|uniref:aggregation-promoting factor C-terminal-like domain-containing protein n=1 Tax=Kitasatospora sp. NPDC051853 TaxID=3364058 RepID=UPI0037A292CD